MPCYQVRLISVEFQAANEQLLKFAAQELGWTIKKLENPGIGTMYFIGEVEVYPSRGKARSANQEAINQLKRAYSQQAVKAAAKAKGWTLESWKEKAGIKKTVAIKF